MSDYTPSMRELRAEHARHVSRRWLHDGEKLTTVQAMAEWDRALAAHNREVAARALEDFAADLVVTVAVGDSAEFRQGVDRGADEAMRRARGIRRARFVQGEERAMSEQEIRPGQVWRRKRDGRRIRIARAASLWTRGPDDWFWNGEDYKGHGVSYGSYIRRYYELVEQGGESDE